MFPTEITVVASVSRLYLNWYTIVSLIYYTYLCPTWSDELWFKTPIKKQKNKPPKQQRKILEWFCIAWNSRPSVIWPLPAFPILFSILLKVTKASSTVNTESPVLGLSFSSTTYYWAEKGMSLGPSVLQFTHLKNGDTNSCSAYLMGVLWGWIVYVKTLYEF